MPAYVPRIRFFRQAQSKEKRQYILLIDESGSMNQNDRWHTAQRAVKTIACHVTEFDPDGIDLIFFSRTISWQRNIRSAAEVDRLFTEHQPGGATDLAGALRKAIEFHIGGPRTGTTVLCVTDGAPDSEPDAIKQIEEIAGVMGREDEVYFSFVQVGDDPQAKSFLKRIGSLQTRFNIVDTLTADEMLDMSIEVLAQRSFAKEEV